MGKAVDIEVTEIKKRGRPVSGVARTNSQRQAAWRLRKKGKAIESGDCEAKKAPIAAPPPMKKRLPTTKFGWFWRYFTGNWP